MTFAKLDRYLVTCYYLIKVFIIFLLITICQTEYVWKWKLLGSDKLSDTALHLMSDVSMLKVLVQLLIIFGVEEMEMESTQVYWATVALEYCKTHFQGNYRYTFRTNLVR